MNYKIMCSKWIQEHIMTTQLIKDIPVENVFIQEQIKWEWHVLIYFKNNFRSKSAPMHVPVHKYDLNYSYLIIHFSLLPQSVTKEIIKHSSQKFSYASTIIDLGISGFSPNEVKFIFT